MKSQFTVFRARRVSGIEDNRGMAKVTIVVEIDSKLVRLVHSPVYWMVAPLTGVAFTFAPLFLYWCGKGTFFPGIRWIVVPACFVVIYLVGMFYIALGSSVVTALRKE
jgi:hypothetical protein